MVVPLALVIHVTPVIHESQIEDCSMLCRIFTQAIDCLLLWLKFVLLIALLSEV